MKILLKITALASLAIIFAMCAAGKSEELKVGTSWKVESLLVKGDSIAVPTDQVPTLVFSDSTNISGNSSCNLFFGNYKLGELNQLAVSPLGMTRMAGPNMAFEGSYVEALSHISSYVLKNNVLSLKDNNGEFVITLSPYTAPEKPMQEIMPANTDIPAEDTLSMPTVAIK